jgi:periplasmic copper chaperone A
VGFKIDFKFGAAPLFLWLLIPAPAKAAALPESRAGNLQVTQVWSRPTPPTASVGVVYLSITNSGTQADRLLDVSSSIAGKVEIHESRNVNGAMQMRAVTGVTCPPGTTVKIEPGGLHMMLIGLTRPLVVGTVFTLTLQFRDAGALTLRVPVEARE